VTVAGQPSEELAMTTLSRSPHDELISDGIHTVTGLLDALRAEFRHACAEYAEARRHQQAKDTPAHRTAVVESGAWIDTILDVYLETAHR
jgi:hypothetical protein